MKNIITCLVIFSSTAFIHPPTPRFTLNSIIPAVDSGHQVHRNLIIVTIDGFRWQELFSGADETLINDPVYTPDTALMKMLFWATSKKERRQKLMPFFWNVLVQKGNLYGNREEGNKVNTANVYTFSYPGYNEIFTGNTDIFVSSNSRKWNKNVNVLEYLDRRESFKGKVVAFTSWDVFPFILNEERNGLIVNSGYEKMQNAVTGSTKDLINEVQATAVYHKGSTRHDQLTFVAAKEYLEEHRPRVLFLGLGETDEAAHGQRYDIYLQKANQADRMLGELWQWIQTTPGYRNNTSIIITTDHGRGNMDKNWSSHSSFIRGSSQTWMALMGPGIEARGEMKEPQQLYQYQLAALMAKLVGEEFDGKADPSALTSSN